MPTRYKMIAAGSLLMISLLLLLSGCSMETKQQVSSLGTTIEDHLGNVRDKGNPYVLSVKGGHPVDYPDKTFGESFEQFFGSPTWTYFLAETGEHVVEFTGFMMYQDVEVKARMQFIVDEEGDEFTAGALSFNDVPQNELVKFAVLSKVFEDEFAEGDGDIETGSAIDPIQNPTTTATTDDSSFQQLIFAAEDELWMLDEQQIRYFQVTYPECFAPGSEDYGIETCLYWATHPEEHQAFAEYWEEIWAENLDNAAEIANEPQHIFAADDVLRRLDERRLRYFQEAHPQCFQPGFYEYDISLCLYWETNPGEYEKYMKAWDDYWAENPDGSMADFPGQRWINEEWFNPEEQFAE